jgi:hypothetical protein
VGQRNRKPYGGWSAALTVLGSGDLVLEQLRFVQCRPLIAKWERVKSSVVCCLLFYGLLLIVIIDNRGGVTQTSPLTTLKYGQLAALAG